MEDTDKDPALNFTMDVTLQANKNQTVIFY